MLKNKRRHGFTIVELLIVIVVIGILASVSVAAFNGISTKAKVAMIQSDLSANAGRIQAYITDFGTYPTYWDIESAASRQKGYMIRASSNTYYASYIYCTMGVWPNTNEVVLALRTPSNKYYSVSTARREPRDITTAAAGTSGADMCLHGSAVPGNTVFGAWGEGPAVN